MAIDYSNLINNKIFPQFQQMLEALWNQIMPAFKWQEGAGSGKTARARAEIMGGAKAGLANMLGQQMGNMMQNNPQMEFDLWKQQQDYMNSMMHPHARPRNSIFDVAATGTVANQGSGKGFNMSFDNDLGSTEPAFPYTPGASQEKIKATPAYDDWATEASKHPWNAIYPQMNRPKRYQPRRGGTTYSPYRMTNYDDIYGRA